MTVNSCTAGAVLEAPANHPASAAALWSFSGSSTPPSASAASSARRRSPACDQRVRSAVRALPSPSASPPRLPGSSVSSRSRSALAKPAETPPKPPTDEQIAAISWEDYAADNTWICPFARDFGHIEEFPERKKDWEDFLSKFALWAPGHVFNLDEKVRNVISAAALMDIGQGQFESELPLFIYQRLRLEVPDDKLKTILSMMAFHPDSGTVIATAPELDLHIGVGDDQVRERLQIFAVKMLGRMLEKLPLEPPTHP